MASGTERINLSIFKRKVVPEIRQRYDLPMRLGLICLLLLSTITISTIPAIAQDQDVPSSEVLLSPSYSRQGSVNLWGWHAAFNGNWNWWAGLNIDLSGHYFSEGGFFAGVQTITNTQVYSLRAGPQFTFIRNKCCTAFMHGLLGGTWVLSTGHAGLASTTFRASGFSAALGPGLDININDNLAWRLFQVDYSFFRVLGEPSEGFRISTGIVLKFD